MPQFIVLEIFDCLSISLLKIISKQFKENSWRCEWIVIEEEIEVEKLIQEIVDNRRLSLEAKVSIICLFMNYKYNFAK